MVQDVRTAPREPVATGSRANCMVSNECEAVNNETLGLCETPQFQAVGRRNVTLPGVLSSRRQAAAPPHTLRKRGGVRVVGVCVYTGYVCVCVCVLPLGFAVTHFFEFSILLFQVSKNLKLVESTLS